MTDDRPAPEILAFGARRNNAQLMLDCRALGYISDEMDVLDPTFGEGAFWRSWVPARWVCADLYPKERQALPGRPIHQWDFTRMPDIDPFHCITFDPPYKLNGTSTGRGPSNADQRYGVGGDYATVQDRLGLVWLGMCELSRVLRPRGHLLLKCQDQISSGKLHMQTHAFTRYAEDIGLSLVDVLHVQGHRPQPAGRRQVHARRDYSTLLVLQKGAR